MGSIFLFVFGYLLTSVMFLLTFALAKTAYKDYYMTKRVGFWCLFLDDERDVPKDYTGNNWVVCRSSEEAKSMVLEYGPPARMSLDHDLGYDDTSMVFLKWLANEYCVENDKNQVPEYVVHSANPVGTKNIISFLESWKKSLES